MHLADPGDVDGEPDHLGGRADRHHPARQRPVGGHPQRRAAQRQRARPGSPGRVEHPAGGRTVEDGGVAEEPGRRRVDRVPPHLRDGAALDHVAAAHQRHPVGDREGLLLVVGDQQRRGARRDEDVAQVEGEPLPQPPVERGERLVEQQQPRLDGQRTGQRDPLPLAAGQAGGAPVAEAGQADERQQLLDPPGRPGTRRPAQPQRVADVAGDALLGEQLPVLEHQREAASVRGDRGQVLAVVRDRAGLEPLQARHRPQQGGLARARRAEHGQHLAGRQVEADPVDGGHPGEADAEVTDLEHLRTLPRIPAGAAPPAPSRPR